MKKLILFVCIFSIKTLLAQPEQYTLVTENLPGVDTVWVYKPAQYDKQQNYPMVYLLHGWSGNYKHWSYVANLQELADNYNFIIVCPDGFYDSWFLNSPLKSNVQFETFFFNDLHPYICTQVSVDTNCVFISGLSMGGTGALYLFCKHPEVFRSAGSSSGVFDLRIASAKHLGLHALLGDPKQDELRWIENSVQTLLPNLQSTNRPFIFDCGKDDPFYQNNVQVKKACDSLELQATFIDQAGEHNRAYWKQAVSQQFDFFSERVNETPIIKD